MVALTCFLNNFGFPYFATLGEELVLRPSGGAIAVWSASGLSKNWDAELLGEKFMEALDSAGPQRLGDVITVAIENYSGAGADRDLAKGYVLFADPALTLKQ
jgi:hypothetical protein